MTRSPQWDAWVAKARAADILAEARARLTLKSARGGAELVGPCPKCGGTDRFVVTSTAKKKLFRCRGCDKSGDVIDLIMFLDGCTVERAIEIITGEGPPKPEAKPKPLSGDGWTTLATYVYRNADGQPYLRVRKCLDENGEKQYPQSHWDGKRWLKGKPQGPKVPYRLPELISAPTGMPVYFCEGEKDAAALASIGFTATTASEGAGAKWDTALTPYFKDRHVVILPDADGPGRGHAQKVARANNAVAASLRILDLYPERTDGSDVSDWLIDDSAGARLAQKAKAAPLWETTPEPEDDDTASSGGHDATDDDAEIERLARMSVIDYERARKSAAKKLGMRPTMLDKVVQVARLELGLDGDDEPAPSLYEHWNVEMANEPVDGGDLLRDIKLSIRRYVFVGDEQITAVALWIIMSWLHERESVVTHSPILFATSAERDSGKTTLLGVINFLARRSLQSVDISGAALFRSIAKWQPTFIVDEADDALSENIDSTHGDQQRMDARPRCHPLPSRHP
jgi:hypothetical protein